MDNRSPLLDLDNECDNSPPEIDINSDDECNNPSPYIDCQCNGRCGCPLRKNDISSPLKKI